MGDEYSFRVVRHSTPSDPYKGGGGPHSPLCHISDIPVDKRVVRVATHVATLMSWKGALRGAVPSRLVPLINVLAH